MDFAIGLSLVNGISGQINQIVGDFKRLDGVTDKVMKQLSEFKNISITGGLLAGAGVKGLQATLDVLDDCIDKAATLQSTSLNLELKIFGKDLLEESKLPQIKADMAELEDKAMDISLNTVFNQNEIEQSMIAMAIGNTAGTAMAVWKGRDNMDIAEETIALIASTKSAGNGDEANSATLVRNFLGEAGKVTFTDPQIAMMENILLL